MEGLGALAVAIAASVVLGIAVILIIHKMIDGEVPFLSGAISIVVILMMLSLAISTSSEVVVWTIFIVSLVSLTLFPYAAEQLERQELRAMETEQLVKAYNAYSERPDNVSAVFEIARRLYAHGLKANAIGLSGAALNTISQKMDPVSNRSFRDAFRTEENQLKNWHREAVRNPSIMRPIPCPGCGHINPLENLLCEKCGRPYLLDIARGMFRRPELYGKILTTFAILAGVIVGAAAVGVMLKGILAIMMILLLVLSAGSLIHRMFHKPKGVAY